MSVDWNTGFDPENTADFVEAIKIAAGLYNAAELAVWLTAPQLRLDNWTPLQLLGCGKSHNLRRVLEEMEAGVYL